MLFVCLSSERWGDTVVAVDDIVSFILLSVVSETIIDGNDEEELSGTRSKGAFRLSRG